MLNFYCKIHKNVGRYKWRGEGYTFEKIKKIWTLCNKTRMKQSSQLLTTIFKNKWLFQLKTRQRYVSLPFFYAFPQLLSKSKLPPCQLPSAKHSY